MLRNFYKLSQKTYNLLINVPKRSAGHSKWQNIRHIKGLKDQQRADIFTKLSRQIKAAIREGGSADPKLNLKLEHLLEQCKRFNMPQATIASVLKTAVVNKDKFQSHIIELKGPGSCILLCEVFTDNLHHLRQGIATILRKNNGKFCDGSVRYMFDEKGIVETKNPYEGKSEEEILEKATDVAIESGAEDVQLLEEGILQFTCGVSNLRSVEKGLEQFKYEITSASVEFIPNKMQVISDSDMETCAKLLEKLESLPEVVKISDNIA